MVRQKLLKERHQLEEEEQILRKRKEQLKLDEEIAAHVAKLSVLKSQSSILRGKESITKKISDGMNSYVEKGTIKACSLSADARSFVPQIKVKTTETECSDPAVTPKEPPGSQYLHSMPVTNKSHAPQYIDQERTEIQHQRILNMNHSSGKLQDGADDGSLGASLSLCSCFWCVFMFFEPQYCGVGPQSCGLIQ
ncbi:hypothetical protein GOODEAATRI_019574 [Goodea atripinnis]|uniref:Uncharacterized protein n=1 Tax=Goodea atripinnis TaxID=208336 RepID=A0ABV0MM55_9TELE